MIVNSSQGGGSKDTWVLEEAAPPAEAGADPGTALVAAAACPACRATAAGPPSSNSSSNSRTCSPGSPTSCTGSAASSRAPSTPRACSTASSTPTCRAARTTRRACACRGTRCWRSWAREPAPSRASRDEVVAPAHARPDEPGLASLSCVTARARGRAHRPRRLLGARCGRRSTRSTSACCGATSPPRCAAGPYSVYAYVRERCGLFWGVTERTMLRDEAHAFLQAGRGDRVRRHGAADAARGAAAGRRGRRGSTCATARRSRCCRRSAASRPTAAPCPRRPTRGRSRASCSTSATTRTRWPPRSSALHAALTAADPSLPQLAAGAAPRAADRRPRLPRPRGRRRTATLAATLGSVQHELAQVDADIAQRYFGGTAQPRRAHRLAACTSRSAT